MGGCPGDDDVGPILPGVGQGEFHFRSPSCFGAMAEHGQGIDLQFAGLGVQRSHEIEDEGFRDFRNLRPYMTGE